MPHLAFLGPGQKALKILIFTVILLAAVGDAQQFSASSDQDTRVVSLSAAVCGNVDIQLFSLDASGRLLFRQSVAGVWQSEPRIVPITVSPKPNSPLTAISWQGSDSNNIRLYYLDGSNGIIEVVGSCSAISCSWSNNNNNGLSNVRTIPTSGLAAAYLGSAPSISGIRVYYLDSRAFVSEIGWYSSSGWDQGRSIGSQAYANSSLALSAEYGQPNLQLYYMTAAGALSQISWTSSGWSSGAVIKKVADSAFRPALTAIAWPGESRRVYYVNASRSIEELLYQSSAWSDSPTSQPALPLADTPGGPIAAVAGATDIRVYYVSGGGQWSVTGANISTITSSSTSNGGKTLAPGVIAAIAIVSSLVLLLVIFFSFYCFNLRFNKWFNNKFRWESEV